MTKWLPDDEIVTTGTLTQERLREVVELIRGVPDDSGTEGDRMIDVAPICHECSFRHLKWISCYGAAKTRAGMD